VGVIGLIFPRFGDSLARGTKMYRNYPDFSLIEVSRRSQIFLEPLVLNNFAKGRNIVGAQRDEYIQKWNTISHTYIYIPHVVNIQIYTVIFCQHNWLLFVLFASVVACKGQSELRRRTSPRKTFPNRLSRP